MYTTYNNVPRFANLIRPKKPITSTILSGGVTESIKTLITNAQKIITIYDRAMPIINQSKPMINNIKTTFKVAKAFKKFSSSSTLEKAFDNLPDFEEVKENKEVRKVTNPFYP